MNLRGIARTEFPKRVKADAFRRCCDAQGIPHCEKCGIKLTAGNIVYEHLQADGLAGEPTLENCGVYCRKVCAKRKTFDEDNPRMQKADRQLKRAFGIAGRKSRPMPGTRASGIRKRFNGQVERWR